MSAAPATLPGLEPGWFGALVERCDREGVTLPVGDAVLIKLRQPEPPVAARGRLAQALHTEWFKGRHDVPPWQMQALVEAIEAWWEVLPPGSLSLSAGLAQAWVRAQGGLGDVQTLSEAALTWRELLKEPEHEAVALALLRQLRRVKGEASIEATLALIESLWTRWTPGIAWTQDLVGSLAMVSRVTDTLPPLRSVAGWLDRLSPHADRPDAQGWHAPLTAAAVRCAALPVLHSLVDALSNESPSETNDGASLGAALAALAALAPGLAVRQRVADAARAWPQQPDIQAEHARQQRDAGATVSQLAPPLRALDPSHPSTAAAWQLLAEYAFHDGDIALARETYERLAEQGELDEHARLRLSHLQLHQAEATADNTRTQRQLPDANPQRLDFAAFTTPGAPGSRLVSALAPLDGVLALSSRHDSPHDVEQIDERAAQALAAFDHRAAAAVEGLTLTEVASVVGQLWELANSGPLDLAHWDGVFPFVVGPAFGTLDGRRCKAQCVAVLQHLIVLCHVAVHRERPLRGAPGDGSLGMLLDLLRQQLDARLALKQADEALADLNAAGRLLGGLGASAVAALRERALLAAGALDVLRAERAAAAAGEAAGEAATGVAVGTAADAAAAPTPPTAPPPPADVLPLVEWDAWLAAEGVTAHAVVHDAPCAGRFDVVDIHGQLRTETHDTVATTLSVARLTDLRVRNLHLLIGAHAGVLKPHPWHLQMGEFPYPHPNVLARGAGGTVLRPARLSQRLDEPLIVLANMDAPFHRNYYHWMVLTLARIHGLLTRGMLKTRKLLLPRELTSWMLGSLRDIGLDESQIRWYEAMDDLCLTDALVASPAEFASATLVEGLRRCLTQAAGLDPDASAPGDRLIYLARRGETRRPMAEAEQVIGIAEELGFDIVAAESLSLLNQVRLFASARGIAGPPGAAFTNLMWAPAGTRVLTLFKQDINGPTFFDLSFLRGQHHRWLQGRSVAGFDAVSVVTSPYSVDLALVRRELQWVRDGVHDGVRDAA